MSLVEQALKKARHERDEKAAVAPSASDAAATTVTMEPPPSPVGRRYQPALPEKPAAPSHKVAVNLDGLRTQGLLPTDGSEDRSRELEHQYRAIKRQILEGVFDASDPGLGPQKLVMMASALSGDGKTFTCVNLAVTLAQERDNTVLLVDADVAKPQLTRVFGLAEAPGLLDLLRDPSLELANVIVGTDIPGLNFLPAGTWSDDAPELFGSERMKWVCSALYARASREIVLFDSSPVLLTTEACLLARIVGQVIVVVNSGVTPQRAVREAMDLVRTDSNRIGLILNQIEPAGLMGYYYGYGHKGGYRYGREGS